MNFDLRRSRALLAALGYPQDFFPAVHVAGTNGKGSVSAMIERSLLLAGHRTGLYTSPHLQRINERFRIDGREISDVTLRRLSARIETLVRRRSVPKPTQFEALTAIAFLWFAEQKVDIAVVETGLGGRLDTTNVLSHVAVSVITNIGLDHMDWLGNTPAKIAAEKAGILRPRVPVITGAAGPALAVIRRTAGRLRAPLTVCDRPYPGAVRLAGPHQRRNASLAAAALTRLDRMGIPVSMAEINRGIASATWPGRLERFTLGAGQNRITCLLDGAHNLPAARALADSLRQMRLRRLTLLFGALRDKDAHGIARVLAPFAARVVAVKAPSDRAIPAAEIARFPAWRRKASAGRLESALQTGRPGETLLVTGSLYVVGAARQFLSKETST